MKTHLAILLIVSLLNTTLLGMVKEEKVAEIVIECSDNENVTLDYEVAQVSSKVMDSINAGRAGRIVRIYWDFMTSEQLRLAAEFMALLKVSPNLLQRKINNLPLKEAADLYRVFNYLEIDNIVKLVENQILKKLRESKLEFLTNKDFIKQFGFTVDLARCLGRAYLTDDAKKKLKKSCYSELEGCENLQCSLCSFSPDNKYIVLCVDKKVRMYHAASGKCFYESDVVRENYAHDQKIVYSAAGAFLIMYSRQEELSVFDLFSRKIKIKISRKEMANYCVNHSGTELAIACRDGTICLYDLISGDCLKEFRIENIDASAQVFMFNPHDTLLVTSLHDGTIMLLDIKNESNVPHTLSGHTRPVVQVVFSSEKKLISISDDHTLRTWDLESTEITRQDFNGHVLHKLNNKGTLLITWDPGNLYKCTLRNIATPNAVEVACQAREVEWPENANRDIIAAVAPSVEINTSQLIQLFNSKTGVLEGTLCHDKTGPLGSGVSRLLFSPDGSLLVSSSFGGGARVWHYFDPEFITYIEKEIPLETALFLECLESEANSPSFKMPEHFKVLYATLDYRLKPYLAKKYKMLISSYSEDDNLKLLEPAALLTLENNALKNALKCERGFTLPAGVTVVSGTLKKERIAAFLQDKTVRIWNAKSGECLLIKKIEFNCIRMQFDVDGERLCLLGEAPDNSCLILNVDERSNAKVGEVIAQWKISNYMTVTSMVFNYMTVTSMVLTREQLILGTDGGDVVVFDLQGKELPLGFTLDKRVIPGEVTDYYATKKDRKKGRATRNQGPDTSYPQPIASICSVTDGLLIGTNGSNANMGNCIEGWSQKIRRNRVPCGLYPQLMTADKTGGKVAIACPSSDGIAIKIFDMNVFKELSGINVSHNVMCIAFDESSSNLMAIGTSVVTVWKLA